MKKDWILDEKILHGIEGKALFYPCSGNDLLVPIEIFSPYVTDFWFIDRGYFSPGHQDTRFYGADVSADKQPPVLLSDNRYKFLNKVIEGPPSWDPYKMDIEPCVLCETYLHIQTGREIRVHRRRGYGFSAIRNETAIGKLGVFFYRGDSQGDGGSGNLWLSKEHLNEVLERLVNGGLLALDGSDGSPWGRGGEISKYAWKSPSQRPSELIKSMTAFQDNKGRRFACVGYAGNRYGPTMIWQVHRGNSRFL